MTTREERFARRMRSREEAQLIDTVSIVRPGESVFDESTGTWTNPETAIYTGGAKIRVQGMSVGHDVEAGGGDIRLNTLVLTLPADTAVAVDDQVTVTASQLDADLVDRSFRVTDVLRSSWQVTRKAMLEEVS